MRRSSHIGALPRAFGKYELLERIGMGGMAEVYRARLPGVGGLERAVVIKRLRPMHAHDRDITRLFVEEAKLAAQVHHENVVQVFELGETEEGELFIAMEYVRGTDLRRLLDHSARADRELSPGLALFILREVLRALAFAHNLSDPTGRPRDLVHCDVTPENIFISREGEVKLGDFGVAIDATRIHDPLADRAKGKLPYMSPEQVLEEGVDARTDVYSAGVVLWEMLAGRRLFPGRTPSEVMAQIYASPRPPPSRFAAQVSAELDALVLRAIRPEIDLRFQSARELCAAIEALPEPRSATEHAAREIRALLEAPVVRPDALEREPEADDGHEELEALDRRHEPIDSGLVTIEPPDEAPVLPVDALERDASTPRPSRVGENTSDPRSLAETHPRMPAVRPPPGEVHEEGSTYRIIRERDFRSEAREAWSGADADTILQAYLADIDAADPALAAPHAPLPWSSARMTPPPVLGGAPPIYCRREGRDEGPLTPAELLEVLEWDARGGGDPSSVHVRVDRAPWLTARQIARLLGETSPLARGPVDDTRLEQGSFRDRSFLELLGQLGRGRRTGRLVVWSDQEAEALELHVLGGALTHINWSSAPFEVWRSLLDDPYLGAEGLPEAFGLALSTETPLAERLPPAALEHVAATRQIHARRRFERALGWVRGGYRFNPAATVSESERGQSLLRILPGMTYCALSLEDLDKRLRPRLGRAHRVDPGLPALRDQLGLTDDELECLNQLGGHEPLGALVARAEQGVDAKFVRTMAYLLGELGLLTER